MVKKIVTALAFSTVVAFCAGQAWGMELARGVITTQIVEREPVDAVESFSASSPQLFCFTRILGGEGEAVTHLWRYQGQEMARVELPVRSEDWRTWSSKKLLPGWVGEWQVEILDGEGTLLATIPFTLN